MERSTVGKISSDLLLKSPDSRDPIELEREMQSKYQDHLYDCVDSSKRLHVGDFFIVVITKRERLMQNVFRNYFFGRQTCPTPDYDQTVWKYHRKEDALEYVWTVPTRDACIYLKENALLVAPEEKNLLQFVLKFADGSLYQLCKRFNGEEVHSNMIVT